MLRVQEHAESETCSQACRTSNGLKRIPSNDRWPHFYQLRKRQKLGAFCLKRAIDISTTVLISSIKLSAFKSAPSAYTCA
jgi:hypothetical protein